MVSREVTSLPIEIGTNLGRIPGEHEIPPAIQSDLDAIPTDDRHELSRLKKDQLNTVHTVSKRLAGWTGDMPDLPPAAYAVAAWAQGVKNRATAIARARAESNPYYGEQDIIRPKVADRRRAAQRRRDDGR